MTMKRSVMSKRLGLKDTAEFLKAHDNFLIYSHEHPDGDTLCSGAALCSVLRRMGKRAVCFKNPGIGKRYLDYIENYLGEPGEGEVCRVSVDVADKKMLPWLGDREIDLVIDHHGSNTGYGTYLLLNAENASCGELMYRLILELGCGVSEEEASLLYIAVTTDTGCFRYTNTNASCLITAAELINAGADQKEINVRFFRSDSRARIAVLAHMYSDIGFHLGGKVTSSILTADCIRKAGATEDDLDDIAHIPGSVECSEVAIFVRELPNGRNKVSLRSKPSFDVSTLAKLYGGGGHPGAAGFKSDLEAEKIVENLISDIEKRWK